MFKHILVPTDGSELSQKAIRGAAIMARENGAQLTVYHARPELRVPFYDEYIRIDNDMWKECARLAEEEAGRYLDDATRICRQEGVDAATLTEDCDWTHQGIINAATERGCDLIFMASHGHRGLSALLLGSETNKVLAHTKIPVLVYR